MMRDCIERLEELTERMEISERALDAFAPEVLAFFVNCPMPAWIKSIEGVMLYCNNAYTEAFGIDAGDYIAKSDKDVWRGAEAEQFFINDKIVITAREGRNFTEKIYNVYRKRHEVLEVCKWPIFRRDCIIGVAGMVTGCDSDRET